MGHFHALGLVSVEMLGVVYIFASDLRTHLEQPKLNLDAVALRLMIITSFLLGATMILLSLSVSTLKQSAAAGLMGQVEWILAVTIALTLIPSMMMLFTCSLYLVSMDLVPFSQVGKLGAISRVRKFLGLTSTLILASFGSIFLVSLGTSSIWSWVLGGIAYTGSLIWVFMRFYYFSRFVYPRHSGQ